MQILNRATDPFLPAVRPHTLAVLADLDRRGLRNHVLVITRHQMKPGDIARLNRLANLKLTLLFTYSGIDDARIEPYPSRVAAGSLDLMSAPARRRYRTILYWRPLVPGLNDSAEHLEPAHALSQVADATVFTGLFYRDQIAQYYRANGPQARCWSADCCFACGTRKSSPATAEPRRPHCYRYRPAQPLTSYSSPL